ncbi:MAG: HAD family hydrolase [Acidimicrobiales bacterium]
MVTISAPENEIRAVLIDLDDTLYPQSRFLEGAVGAVAQRASELGLDRDRFATIFQSVLDRGSDTGHTIETALVEFGCAGDEVLRLTAPLVSAFLHYRPVSLECYPHVPESLERLAQRAALVCLTDGQPDLQRAKFSCLDVDTYFRALVITDELGGRSLRKPATACLNRVSEILSIPVRNFFVIGDRPDKDVALAHFGGIGVVRVRQGEYRAKPSPQGIVTVDDFPSAVDYLIATYF